MSYEIVATIIFFGSLLGIGVILFRKIPVLVKLPETNTSSNFQIIFLKLKSKIGTIKHIPFEKFLQKPLLKFKILTLKIENKTSSWLEKLRQESLKKGKKEKSFSDNYWPELKKVNQPNQKRRKKKTTAYPPRPPAKASP